jgi:uncharacterized membrane protein YebE (DUF533 family)
MDIQQKVIDTAKRAAMVWATKKGLQWTGSLVKIGLIAGAGYYVYTIVRDYRNDQTYLDEFEDEYYGI